MDDVSKTSGWETGASLVSSEMEKAGGFEAFWDSSTLSGSWTSEAAFLSGTTSDAMRFWSKVAVVSAVFEAVMAVWLVFLTRSVFSDVVSRTLSSLATSFSFKSAEIYFSAASTFAFSIASSSSFAF